MNFIQVLLVYKIILLAVRNLLEIGCHILNVYAPTEDKTEDMKDSFYKKLEHVFDKITK
jgi:hypothetical protein